MPEKLKQEIEKSVALLKQGKILLYPTDTIWGIGCDATNKKAVDKVFKLKNRHKQKSMIVLLDSADKLCLYVDKVPQIAFDLIENAEFFPAETGKNSALSYGYYLGNWL